MGLRVPHYPEIFASEPELGFFEIISENFMVDGGPPLANLDRILERYPVVQHGVSLSIASADPLDFDYLARLKRLCERTRTPWFSDHLCWSGAHGRHHHDLLPLPYTGEYARFIAEKARVVQDFIGLPFALENLSSYVSFSNSEMTEWEFYREVVEQADAFMLLDVNNVYVSSVNHGFDPLEYLDAIPWERVIQVHVAGHTEQDDGTILDTHDHHVKPEVWELYRHVHERTGGVSTILEWDAGFLSFEETLAEANKAKAYQASTGGAHGARQTGSGEAPVEPRVPESLGELQAGFGRSITTPFEFKPGGDVELQVDRYDPDVLALMVPRGELSGPERLGTYNRVYWFRLFTVILEEYPLLRHLLGANELNQLVSAYVDACPPGARTLQHLADELPAFMEREHRWNRPELIECVRLEHQYQRTFDAAHLPQLDPSTVSATEPLRLQPHWALFEEHWNLVEWREQVRDDADDAIEVALEETHQSWAIFRVEDQTRTAELGPLQFQILSGLDRGLTLDQAVQRVAVELNEEELGFLGEHLQGWFARWTSLGWFAAID